MAGIAKRLRPRFVVPVYVGSIPITRPIFSHQACQWQHERYSLWHSI
jgi:hypothetical protein